jgi:hypothetical protein
MQKYFSANTSGAPPCERPCAPQRSSFAVRVALERDGRFWKTEGTKGGEGSVFRQANFLLVIPVDRVSCHRAASGCM